MPEVKVTIGGRDYDVACQAGEEQFLISAAAMLDTEASVLAGQIGRIPEARMLLMAGLMLADKTAGMEDQVREMKTKLATVQAELEDLRNRPDPEPRTVEVAVIPPSVSESLAELAARAESIAAEAEDRLSA